MLPCYFIRKLIIYDIIGDIYGHVTLLRNLIAVMDYSKKAGVRIHPNRTAVFLGDFIDPDPYQLKTVNLVRAMVEDGYVLAVMGNHAFKAVA